MGRWRCESYIFSDYESHLLWLCSFVGVIGGVVVCWGHVRGRACHTCFAMTPHCQTPQAPAGWAACYAQAGTTESDIAWSALHSGCAGQRAFGSSSHRGGVLQGGSPGCRPAGSLKDGLEAFQHVCGLGHLDDLRWGLVSKGRSREEWEGAVKKWGQSKSC